MIFEQFFYELSGDVCSKLQEWTKGGYDYVSAIRTNFYLQGQGINDNTPLPSQHAISVFVEKLHHRLAAL